MLAGNLFSCTFVIKEFPEFLISSLDMIYKPIKKKGIDRSSKCSGRTFILKVGDYTL